MGDDDGDGEPKYKLFTPEDPDKERPNGSQNYGGDGKAYYLNKDTYFGIYVEGYRKGKGTYTWNKKGDSYEGEWGGQGMDKDKHQDNQKHGFGKMVYRDLAGGDEDDGGGDGDETQDTRGGSYLGWYHNGHRGCSEEQNPEDTVESQGTFTYVNGDVYVGQWKSGKKHGKGTYTYAKDGSKLIGDWEKGKMQVGKWVFPNGTFFSGQFRYNKPYGDGVWVFPDGNQLTGKYTQKNQPGDDDGGGGDDEDNPKPKPDPKVWCNFKHSETRAVRGGCVYPPKVEIFPCPNCGCSPCRYSQ